MKIRVDLFWQDLSGNKIEAGYYDIKDPKLLGKGQYLINNGRAVIIDDLVQPIADESEATSESIELVTFTNGAQEYIDENNLSEDELVTHFASIGKYRVRLSDVQEYNSL